MQSFSSLLHDYYAAPDGSSFEYTASALIARRLGLAVWTYGPPRGVSKPDTYNTDHKPLNRMAEKAAHGFHVIDLVAVDDGEHSINRPVAVPSPILPALEYAVSTKRASKLSRRLPSGKYDNERHLVRMSNHSDQLAKAMAEKVQAPHSVAEQIAKLVAHDTKLLKQAEAAKIRGKVKRVQSLMIQIEANRKRTLELIERFADADHAFANKPLVPTIAFGDAVAVGAMAMPVVSKPVVSKAAPLPRHAFKHVSGIGKYGTTQRTLIKPDAGKVVKAEVIKPELKPEAPRVPMMTKAAIAKSERDMADALKRREAFDNAINQWRNRK